MPKQIECNYIILITKMLISWLVHGLSHDNLHKIIFYNNFSKSFGSNKVLIDQENYIDSLISMFSKVKKTLMN